MPAYEETLRFGDMPADMARRFGDREGLVFEDRRWTFGEIAIEVDAAAKALIALGVARGDHVALWLNNSDDWIFIQFAALKIGAVLTPINTRFRTADLDYVLRQSDSAFLITHDVSGPIDYLAMTREVAKLPATGVDLDDPNFPALKKVVVLGAGGHRGVVDWAQAKAAGDSVTDVALAARADAVSAADIALILYTSGTTGFPKGAMHDHIAIRNVQERAMRMAITRNDVILNYLPLFHLFGFSEGGLMSMATGAKQVVTATFDPEASLDLVEREGVTIVHGFEAHVKGLTEAQEARPRDLSTLRTGVVAAGMQSATPVVSKAGRVLAPFRGLSGFGMTEVLIGVGLSALDDDEAHRFEASGYPSSGYDVRIADPVTGAALGPGVEGELQTRGRYLMQGYYKKPRETAEAYAEDGWFRTGDAAMWLADGHFRFLGRYKDMLKVGGENVDPMEVEGFLLEHPAVHQVAVVGLPDVRLSEVPVAFVQRAPGAAITGEAVMAYCRGKVASFKIPRHVVFVDDFPMTASGKIRKVDLRADAAERFAEAAAE